MTPAAIALARLRERDPRVPGLGTLLDADALGAVLGHPVHLRRVRYKPATSVIAAFDSPHGAGWAAAYDGPDKARVSSVPHRRADPVPGIAHAVTGTARTDRALAPAMRELDRARPGELTGAQLLRHNPGRRLVLAEAGGGAIVKVVARAADRLRPDALAVLLSDVGVPVLPAERLTDRAWRAPYWGEGDLTVAPSPDAAFRAGAALAALHRAPTPVAARPVTGPSDAAAAATAIAAVLPELASRAAALAARHPAGGPERVVHGDFSADQVLVGADGEVRLIDFDRLGTGDPMRDLAGFAVEERMRLGASPLIGELIEGYRAAGGELDDARLRAWVPLCALGRAIEPFRRCDPDWPALVDRALAVGEGWTP
ncbi:phosphotransferase family protein [Microbacterium oleivorans]|uniref:Phosphotransferase n=1 Tax=Microbacterium oleivorans TaxID=273677 RepID=A0A7D5JF17_9MICO|nr:phosphotransferase [Microbacterium oleivorans]QLD11518.1 phosphotransferase [Microbacterium oleivorans]